MLHAEGSFVVVVNAKHSTNLPNGTYAIVDKVDASYVGNYAFRYKIRVVSTPVPNSDIKVGEFYWIHPHDVVSAEFYCTSNAYLVIRDALTDFYLERLKKARSKARKAEIIEALQVLHPKFRLGKKEAECV